MRSDVAQTTSTRTAVELVQRVTVFPLTRIVVGSAVCMLVGLAIIALLLRPALSALGLTENTARAIRFGMNAVVILVTYWWLFRAYEKRRIREL
jgi:hypothetical protein